MNRIVSTSGSPILSALSTLLPIAISDNESGSESSVQLVDESPPPVHQIAPIDIEIPDDEAVSRKRRAQHVVTKERRKAVVLWMIAEYNRRLEENVTNNLSDPPRASKTGLMTLTIKTFPDCFGGSKTQISKKVSDWWKKKESFLAKTEQEVQQVSNKQFMMRRVVKTKTLAGRGRKKSSVGRLVA
ncbi:hypothetical protein GEMRC1_014096 [Eukaryota sp. GEM-RC1]